MFARLFFPLALIVTGYFLTSCEKMLVASLNSHPKVAEVVKSYKQDAEGGDAQAQFEVGGCYYYGIGVSIDYAEAVKWYRKAAKQGNAEAQAKLGFCYANGHGVPKDHVEAYALCNLASDSVETARVNRDKLARFMDSKQMAAAQKREKEVRRLYSKPSE